MTDRASLRASLGRLAARAEPGASMGRASPLRLALLCGAALLVACDAVDSQALTRAAYAIVAVFYALLALYVLALVGSTVLGAALLVRALRTRSWRPAAYASVVAAAGLLCFFGPPAWNGFPFRVFVNLFGPQPTVVWYAPSLVLGVVFVGGLVGALGFGEGRSG